MRVNHSPRLSIFNFPELANKDLIEKLNKKGAESIGFHVQFNGFTFMTHTYGAGEQQCLLDVSNDTELSQVIRAYKTLFSVLGKDIENEPARIHDLILHSSTKIESVEEINKRILADKRVKMELAEEPFYFNKIDNVLVGTIKNSTETYFLLNDVYRSKDGKETNFQSRVWGKSSWSKPHAQSLGRLNDLEALDYVLSEAAYLE
jgi:hypothetical protein